MADLMTPGLSFFLRPLSDSKITLPSSHLTGTKSHFSFFPRHTIRIDGNRGTTQTAKCHDYCKLPLIKIFLSIMRKPKNKTPIQLPPEQPDCCFDCPLCGLIPKDQPDKPKGSKETHVCLATWEALTGRGIKVRASGRDSHHPLKRPCDTKWEAWMKLPERCYLLPDVVYLHYRLPFENGLQFKIKFHK